MEGIDITLRSGTTRTDKEKEKLSVFSVNSITKSTYKKFYNYLYEWMESEDDRSREKARIDAIYGNKVDELALIMLKVVLFRFMLGKDGIAGAVPITALAKDIGRSMMEAMSLTRLESEHSELVNYIDKAYKRDVTAKLRAKRKTAQRMYTQYEMGEDREVIKIGIKLVNVLVESGIGLFEIVRASDAGLWNNAGMLSRYAPSTLLVVMSEDLKYILLNLDYQAEDIGILKPKIRPLLDKPERVTVWRSNTFSTDNGRPKTVIKVPRRKCIVSDFYNSMKTTDINEFIDVHRAIEETKWEVNTEILDIMNKVFMENIRDSDKEMYAGTHYSFCHSLLGGLPLRYSVEPDKVINKSLFGQTTISEKNGKEYFIDSEKEAIKEFNRVKNDILYFNEKNLSKALSLMTMLSTAEEYRDKQFYFTYTFDYRGRIYPVQQVFNPQADSKGKALLRHAEGRKLNDAGKYWFKVHGANSWGYDKLSLEERVTLIEEKEQLIVSIAEDPIGNSEHWKDADEPYVFLAFCLEYSKALRDPEFKVKTHVPLDATCSGIQIYSGLLKDREGAKAVNVIGVTRSDIYQLVADEVNRMLEAEEYPKVLLFNTSGGIEKEILTRPIANSLKGKITRKLTKRNTMTQPYSVTMRGMQDQLKAELDELEEQGEKFWVGDNWIVSRLLSQLNKTAIDRVVKGAEVGRRFIMEVTRYVSRKKKGLVWTTPMGFKVYQTNVKTESTRISTYAFLAGRGLQRVDLRINKPIRKLNAHNQVNAVAPNVIHSLDSALLQMTVRKCRKDGITSFALIHDSYGVHPNDVPILNKNIRESYVELFEGDYLIEWAIEVLTNAGYTFKEIGTIFEDIENPMINDLDIKEVLDSKYIFS